MTWTGPDFWIALLQIIGINIVLSGDNAVVIALAARGLPAEQQKRAVAWGSAAAVVMRIVLTIVAVELLRMPYLKLAGAALLLWIAVQLLLPEDGDGSHGQAATTLPSAIKTILLADLVMSLDNVVGVAAAAKGEIVLLMIGLGISIPLVIFASRLLLSLMDRFPIIIRLGAGLLGWVAGEMAVTDPVTRPWVDGQAPFLHWGAPLLGAILVLVVGQWWAARKVAARRGAAPAPAGAANGEAPALLRRVLLALDGSDNALKATRRLIALVNSLRSAGPIDVHLINVQRPMPGTAARFVSTEGLQEYRKEQGDAALAGSRALLASAGIAHRDHQVVGPPGPTIAEAARTLGCDLIVLGARGLGTHTAALLGSVAQGTIENAAVPVLVVK
jgi:YjbE family integral membrane protein